MDIHDMNAAANQSGFAAHKQCKILGRLSNKPKVFTVLKLMDRMTLWVIICGSHKISSLVTFRVLTVTELFLQYLINFVSCVRVVLLRA